MHQNLSFEIAASKSSSSTSRYFCNADKVLCPEIFFFTFKGTPARVDLLEACASDYAHQKDYCFYRTPAKILLLVFLHKNAPSVMARE